MQEDTVVNDEPESDGKVLPIVCARCGARANGLAFAHCAKCHRTFSAVSGFDRHRRGGECVDPATVGMIEVTRRGYARWQLPGPEEKIHYAS